MQCLRHQGLARGLHKWMAVTETAMERHRAANALRKLQRQGLNRAYQKWVGGTAWGTHARAPTLD